MQQQLDGVGESPCGRSTFAMSALVSKLAVALVDTIEYSMGTRLNCKMAYKVYKRTAARVETPALSIVPDGRIAINAASARVLAKAGIKSVLLLWDAANQKVALKAAPRGDKNAYALSLAPDKHSGSIRAKSFVRHIGWSAPRRILLPAAWDERERMLEITLPGEYVSSVRNEDPKRKTKTGQ